VGVVYIRNHSFPKVNATLFLLMCILQGNHLENQQTIPKTHEFQHFKSTQLRTIKFINHKISPSQKQIQKPHHQYGLVRTHLSRIMCGCSPLRNCRRRLLDSNLPLKREISRNRCNSHRVQPHKQQLILQFQSECHGKKPQQQHHSLLSKNHRDCLVQGQ